MNRERDAEREVQLDALRILGALWRRRLLLVAATVLGGGALLVHGLVRPPVYRAEVTILPQQGDTTTGMFGSLASMVGAPLTAEQSYEQLYPEIVKSDRLLDRVLEREWFVDGGTRRVSLFDVFGISDAPGVDRVHELERVLRNDAIDLFRDKSTGYMVLEVTVPEHAALAADLANFLVDELDRFNQEIRSNKAQEHYEFVEQRLEAVEAELIASENALTEFVVDNRGYQESPRLRQTHGVLSREVQANTSIWVELRRQRELAELERNKTRTAVDVLDRAEPPVEPANPAVVLYAAAGSFLGFSFALAVVLVWALVAQLRRRAEAEPRG